MKKRPYYIPLKTNTASGMDPKVERLASPMTAKSRQELCNTCKHRTRSNFCAVNKDFIPEFVKLKVSSCPENVWSDTYSDNRKR